MYAFDEDSCNTIAAEELKQYKEERQLKNQILNIYNYDRKKAEWQRYFAQPQLPQTNQIF